MKKTAFMWVALLALLTLAGQVHAEYGPDNAAQVESGEFPEFEKARELYNGGRYNEAVKMLKKYVEKRPVPEAYYMIAYSLYKLGRHDEANKYFKQAFLLEPTYSPTPELEEKLNRPLKEARPGAVVPERPTVIPKLIEKRPPVLAEPEEEPSVMPREKPATAPTEARAPETVPPPPETLKAPEAVPPPPVAVPPPPEAPEAKPEPEEAVPAPPETAEAPEAPPTPEAVPPPPGVSQSTEVTEAAPDEKQLISKAAKELKTKGERLSREASRLKERPEVAKLRAQVRAWLEQTDPQVLLKGLGILIFFYLFLSYCLFRIAKKLRVGRPWLAWLPVFQIWTFIRAADKSLLASLLLFFVIMFVPFLNIIASIYVWMGIIYNTGRNKWLALLVLVPGVNILFVVYLAFAKILRRAPAEKDMLGVSGVSDVTAEPSLPDLDFDLEEDKGPEDSWPDEPLT